MSILREILKTGPKRTVWIESVDGVPTRVVKRFHAPGALDRLKDGHRARREVAALGRLAKLGLRVPEGATARQVDGFWQLETDAIPGGASLEHILAGRAPWPARPGVLAHELAAMVLQVEQAGLVHPDPHPGNVVIDGDGCAWLIDLARVRRGTMPADLLVRLAASVREISSRTFRRRYVRAEEALRGAPHRDRGQLLDLEDRARDLRRDQGEAQLDRWTRESGIITGTRGGHTGWRVRTLPAGPWTRLRPKSEDAALRIWKDLARWQEHRIPGPMPVLLRLGPRPRIVVTAYDKVSGDRARALRDRGLEKRHPIDGPGA
jgi:tRNA A-37 threonylcarbamoyl transferase component Bud32